MRDRTLFDQEHTISLGASSGVGRVLKPGDVVGGNYRLKTLLGQGGMGFVFCAQHTMIGRDYALKVMASDKVNEINWRRFESEGRAIAALDHPNIVKVYNMGVDAGDCPYIVMDLLEGNTLADEVRSGRKIAFTRIVDIFIQTAKGLEYAQGKGIVHRDVKPSNMMISQGANGKPVVRLVDFGLAKLSTGRSTGAQRITGTGEIFGSPYYMSPEQCLGNDVDARSDIYSLGCALYETFTGAPPFAGTTPLETVLMHSEAPIPKLNGALEDYESERRINHLLARMLAKRKEDRYQTMAQVAHDLERIQSSKDIGRQTQQPSSASFAALPPARSSDTLSRIDLGGRYSRPAMTTNEEAGQARYAPNPGRRKQLLLAGVGSVILLSGLALFAASRLCYKDKTQATTLSQQASTLSQQATQIETVGAAGVKSVGAAGIEDDADTFHLDGHTLVFQNEHLKEATAKYKSAGPICATPRGPVQTIHFPAYTVGEVEINGVRRDAIGNLDVPAGASLGLNIDWCHKSWTLVNLYIFQRVDTALFDSLRVKANALNVADGKIPDIQVPSIFRMLEWASKWTKLHKLTLEAMNCIKDDDSFLCTVDRLPHLNEFIVEEDPINLKLISRHKFIHQLHALDVSATNEDVDYLLHALAGSPNISSLSIDGSKASPAAILSLKDCPHLDKLQIVSSAFRYNQIEVLAKLPSLKQLTLIGFRPTLQDILTLSASSSKCDVDIKKSKSSAEERRKFMKMLPRLHFDSDKPDQIRKDDED